MDDADRASDLNEFILAANLREQSAHEQPAQATGFCLYCDAPLNPGQRWCDADCRDDWEKYIK